ncbi:MAG: hypothetical protein H6586_02235 [Flavobacteriales bacterium]|nr:hypothetical protein [Flavobacteriales bacterium]
MKNLLIILIVLIASGGCSDSGDIKAVDVKKLDSKYCTNQIELLSPYGEFVDLDFKFHTKGENTIEKIFIKLGDEFCDFRVDLGVPFNVETIKFGASNSSIPLNVKIYKQCNEDWGCSLHNYIEVLYNSNHQILLEGEYIQKEELDSMIPKYYNDNEILYDLSPRKTFISIQWDLSVEEDSLSSLFGAIIDGYLKSADIYTLKRYKTDICNLTNDQLDSLKIDFPFNLELPSYELVVPPVQAQPNAIPEKSDLLNFKFSKEMFFNSWAFSSDNDEPAFKIDSQGFHVITKDGGYTIPYLIKKDTIEIFEYHGGPNGMETSKGVITKLTNDSLVISFFTGGDNIERYVKFNSED